MDEHRAQTVIESGELVQVRSGKYRAGDAPSVARKLIRSDGLSRLFACKAITAHYPIFSIFRLWLTNAVSVLVYFKTVSVLKSARDYVRLAPTWETCSADDLICPYCAKASDPNTTKHSGNLN